MIIIKIKILVFRLTAVILIAINNNKKHNDDNNNYKNKNSPTNIQ